MNPDLFDYDLPRELIAQEPADRRDASRMLLLDRRSGTVSHDRFARFPELLREDDLLVLNDTRVLPARLRTRRERTNARVEFLALHPSGDDTWICLARPARRARPGETYLCETSSGHRLEVLDRVAEGGVRVRALPPNDFPELLEAAGEIPLPPYIERETGDPRLQSLDRTRYQTVFARTSGAVAAPTAGLHFTGEILRRIRERGVEIRRITLHVGPGTFRPVRVSRIEEHRMHREPYVIPESTAAAVNTALDQRRRIVAVGTTVVRTLEASALKGDGRVLAETSSTDLFIRPPYRFRVVGALLTNFHLPRSTLLMLVSAFAGREHVLAAYREAVRERYRFYSYGDCMFVS